MSNRSVQIEKAGRLRRLDVLRAVAVLLVLARHMRPPSSEDPQWIRQVANLLSTCGWVGVDLFFVLSGFLISGLLYREYDRFGEIRPLRFLIRRGLKIYPGFYCLFVATIVAWQIPSLRTMKWMKDLTWGNFVAEGFFLGNYLPPVWNHTWSLAVEEQFYIGLAILFPCLTRRKTARPFDIIPSLFLGTAVAVLLLRIASWYAYGGNYAPTHLRLDSLFFGVAIGYFYRYERARLLVFDNPTGRGAILGLTTATLILSMILPLEEETFWYTIGFTLLYVVFGLLLIGTLNLKVPSPIAGSRIGNGLAAIGFYSYAIYLWHMPVRRGLFLALDAAPTKIPFLVQYGLFVVGAVSAGVVMGRIVEMPVLVLRDRLFPSRSGAAVAPQEPRAR